MLFILLLLLVFLFSPHYLVTWSLLAFLLTCKIKIEITSEPLPRQEKKETNKKKP